MIMKKLFCSAAYNAPTDLALLILRLVCGYAFVIGGSMKMQAPTSWMGPEATYSGFMQVLATISEFGGGIALMTGLLTRAGAFGIACTMTVAIYEHINSYGDPFINPTGGGSYQMAATYLAIGILLLVTGAGKFSADYLICRALSRHKAEP